MNNGNNSGNNEGLENITSGGIPSLSSGEEVDGAAARENPAGSPDQSRLVFHYNREHRLAKASEAVRRTYTEGYTPNKGFVKGLTANAGLRSILSVIIILCAVIMIVSLFGPAKNEGSFFGVSVRLRAFVFDETLFVAVTFRETASPPEGFPAVVKAEITAFDSGNNPVSVTEVTGRYDGKEMILRDSMTDFDFTAVQVSLSLLNSYDAEGTEKLVLSAVVERE